MPTPKVTASPPHAASARAASAEFLVMLNPRDDLAKPAAPLPPDPLAEAWNLPPPTAKLFPLEIVPGRVVNCLDQLTTLIVGETDDQVKAKGIIGRAGEMDFAISCDALNLQRVVWRCRLATYEPMSERAEELARLLCEYRQYRLDEFRMVLVAVKKRMRTPYGLDPLTRAYYESIRQPIRMKYNEDPGGLLDRVASIALYLHHAVQPEPILLPIDALQRLLCVRKAAVSGAVLELQKRGFIRDTGAAYHTGRARQFRFLAKYGTHYEFASLEEEEM